MQEISPKFANKSNNHKIANICEFKQYFRLKIKNQFKKYFMVRSAAHKSQIIHHLCWMEVSAQKVILNLFIFFRFNFCVSSHFCSFSLWVVFVLLQPHRKMNDICEEKNNSWTSREFPTCKMAKRQCIEGGQWQQTIKQQQQQHQEKKTRQKQQQQENLPGRQRVFCHELWILALAGQKALRPHIFNRVPRAKLNRSHSDKCGLQ